MVTLSIQNNFLKIEGLPNVTNHLLVPLQGTQINYENNNTFSILSDDGLERINIGGASNVNGYATDAELESYLTSIFVSKTNVVDASGNVNSEQYPLSVDGDSVHAKDIDIANSVMNNFTGSPCDFFNDLHSENIDSTAINPKEVLIHFQRTIVAPLIGIGSSEGGSFSNVKVIAILSGNIEVVVADNSTDNTDKTTQFFQFPNAGFNALKLQFHTADTISITNIFMPKITPVSAIMETAVKYASSYKSPYLENTGSQDLRVDGSTTPVDFIYTIAGLTSAKWIRSFVDLQDGAQNFDPANFGAISNGLTNGVDIIVEKDGVEYVIENWKTNMDISMTMYDFSSPFKIGAYVGRWTIASDLGTPVTLFPNDKIIIRINDNLTALDAFRFRVKLSQ
jgi:hypothetical protein